MNSEEAAAEEESGVTSEPVRKRQRRNVKRHLLSSDSFVLFSLFLTGNTSLF